MRRERESRRAGGGRERGEREKKRMGENLTRNQSIRLTSIDSSDISTDFSVFWIHVHGFDRATPHALTEF